MKKLTIIISLLSVWAITNAQTDEKSILDTNFYKKHELIITPEIAEMLIVQFKIEPIENFYRFGITNISQLENLQPGRPAPVYWLSNDVDTLMFTGWRVSFKYEDKIIFFAHVKPKKNKQYKYTEWSITTLFGEDIRNYEREDLIGFLQVRMPFMEYYYIKSENKDIFLQVYDQTTRKYFKNEYSFSEIINLKNRALEIRKSPTRESLRDIYGSYSTDENDFFDTNFPQKHELKMTQEITEMLINELYWNLFKESDENLSMYHGITNRTQLENLHLGKPIPNYVIDIDNERLVFLGGWHVPVMSNSELLFTSNINEYDGQYRYSGGGVEMAKILHTYEHKELIIGFTQVSSSKSYLIIRKENKDIFVQMYDYAMHEYFKNEYSFSEIINLLKK